MKTAILAIILFCVMIYPHELGHFIAAKLCNVQVNEFSFGMGPRLWKKQRGETLHSIRLFPIGGFCAMEGEDGTEEGEYNPRAFCNKKGWQKLIVLFAGAFMNVVSAIVIMSLVLGVMGFTTTKIAEVTPDSSAEIAGITAGDKVLRINDYEIEAWGDVSTALTENEDNEAEVVVLRDGSEKTFKLTPVKTEVYDDSGNLYGYRYIIGITCKVSHNPVKAVIYGVKATYNTAITMYESLFQLFTGEVGVDELSGPVGVVKMVSDTSKVGLWYFGYLMSIICLNLAIVNLLPLPALDGGRIIFVLYNMITKKNVNAKVEGIIHAVGLVLLFGLMIFVTWNDIAKIVQ